MEKWKKDGVIDYLSERTSPKLKYGIVEDAKKNIAFDVVHKIAVPTLITHGDEDEVVPYAGSVKLAELSSHISLHTVGGSDHNYSSSFHFEEMSQVLSDFLIKESGRIN